MKNISQNILDDWETDANYDNKLTENEQRWGKEALGHRSEAIDMRKLIEETEKADDDKKKKLISETGLTGSKGKMIHSFMLN